MLRPAKPTLLATLALGLVIAAVLLARPFISAMKSSNTYTVRGPAVGVWLTTTDGQHLLAPQSGLTFTTGNPSGPIIDVNDRQQYQQIVGFGGAMTDSSAYLIGDLLTSAQRSMLMQNLFGTSGSSSIHMSFVRIPMGSSDFSATPPSNPQPYSYDDMPAGQTDPHLTNFSINHDLTYIIPTLQQALQINPQLTFMANPWSPPAWMKTNGSMIASVNGMTGTLINSDFAPFAEYFVKFIQDYQARGVPISYITPQNEPLYIPTGYPGMSFSQDQEVSFINNNLGPDLAAAHLSTKILGYDFNRQNTAYPEALLSQASSYVSGISWHCYARNPGEMTTIHNLYPTRDQFETECSPGIITQSIIDETLDDVQNWARTVVLWNIALDPHNEPRLAGGCGGCSGMVQINQSTHAITYTTNYYQLGQVSKFVMPGAYHISSTTGDSNLNNAAFTNPDGSHVLVVHNTSASSDTFNVYWDSTQSFAYTLPAGGIVTFKWSNTTTPGTIPTPTPSHGTTPTTGIGGSANAILSGQSVSSEPSFNGTNGAPSAFPLNGNPCRRLISKRSHCESLQRDM